MATLNRACPNCDSRRYTKADRPHALPMVEEKPEGPPVIDPERATIVIPIVCKDCGFIQLFSRKVAGDVTVDD